MTPSNRRNARRDLCDMRHTEGIEAQASVRCRKLQQHTTVPLQPLGWFESGKVGTRCMTGGASENDTPGSGASLQRPVRGS